VPIQSAQCWFPGLAISNAAEIKTHFSAEIHGSNFIKQHSEKLSSFEISNMLIAVNKIN